MAGTTSVTIVITGEEKVIADLSRRTAPQLTVTLRKAVKAGASAARPFIMASAPVRTGATRRSVSARKSRLKPGETAAASVGPRIWYRHFPIVGTSRGIKPNPWVARGMQAGSVAARRAMEAVYRIDVAR